MANNDRGSFRRFEPMTARHMMQREGMNRIIFNLGHLTVEELLSILYLNNYLITKIYIIRELRGALRTVSELKSLLMKRHLYRR
ncbi:MAG: hypothetical protein A2176_05885 [Spirochaetes bacterium RBG_13_51_14]|nr:MAG: hypothetical protein A2176_05885 [Spirochaetes bacterium RBG_13_51_14]